MILSYKELIITLTRRLITSMSIIITMLLSNFTINLKAAKILRNLSKDLKIEPKKLVLPPYKWLRKYNIVLNTNMIVGIKNNKSYKVLTLGKILSINLYLNSKKIKSLLL